MTAAPLYALRDRLAAEGNPSDVPDLRNLEAEQNVLGSLMYEGDRIEDVAGILEGEVFSEPFHQRLWEAIKEAASTGRSADPVSLQDRFKADPAFNDFGGLSYLATLVDRCGPATLREHALILSDLATRRALADLGRGLAHNAGDPEADGQTQIANLEARLADLAAVGSSDAWHSVGDMVAVAVENARNRDGAIRYTWGIDALDEMTGGLNAGESVIVAGRPGAMKTGVGINIALANAKRGLGTTLISLEMSSDPMGLRMACAEAHDRSEPVYSAQPGKGGNAWYISAAKGQLEPMQWRRLEVARDRLRQLPLKVETRAGLTMSRIEAAVRRLHRKWKLQNVEPGPVIIDHIGIVRPEKNRNGAKHAETADVSRAAAEMAKRLGVPVVALCQLNRGVEGRDDKRPGLADLRNAGELEEDARAVVMIYRPAYYLRPPMRPESIADAAERESKLAAARNQLFLCVEKNSHGPTGQVEAWCDPATSKVDNLHIGGGR